MTATASSEHYYVPEGSRWPIIGVIGIFFVVLGMALWVNDITFAPYLTLTGTLIIAYLFFGWFGDVIDESMSGKYSTQVDTSFRQGMIWFITSEVFFFIALFGTLYYIRAISLPWLGGEGHLGSSNLLWDGFQATWPLLATPGAGGEYVQGKEAMGAGGIPLYNTIILLSSGATLTWAHWGLKKDSKSQLVGGLALTVLLGFIFFGFQAYEYYHAYNEMDLRLDSGVYGSTFYMLTGFHGMHVTIGTIMLLVILIRSIKGHFSHEKHFAFEAVAWYWHFVDVVWLGLYFFVYWL
ncbi:cytochrome c oxidase subunit 3 [Gammaproteobacteria bacterium 45_16_T64]|nr:cytochrome c oxidase subunit 3 [Gammaproteobacteria bacterium 45_16_T64]